MDPNQPQSSSLFQMSIDESSTMTLKSAASWAKVLAILGILFGIIILAGGFLYQNMITGQSSAFDEYGTRTTRMAGNMVMVVCVIFGLLSIIGSVFALNFGNKISASLQGNNVQSLRGGFAGLKNYFAFWSILMIIYLLLLIISLLTGSLGKQI